ncbi:ThiF family adenylyltransferase [Aliisedimentitalea scapharcae]|uniref:ThiF family adenylyltransferase n=1 Tax=Aliisedimentitalea scapharcae TaxID=1524259 RepID=A0ABZ2XY09_9RHOB
MNRYARQMLLPDVGQIGQARLADAHVLVVGAGGLGCPVLQYLAGAGVGEITLFDPDLVEEGNLHRQPLYRITDIGHPKAQAAQAHLLAAQPDLRLHPRICALTPANAHTAVALSDLVIDAADSFAVSYILSDTCLSQGKPLISASALGQSGYVGGFCCQAPSLRAVFPDLPEHAASCATAGVLGPVVGVIGSLQAQMALRVLLACDPSPLGTMATLDLATMQLGQFSFLGAPEPDRQMPFVALQDVKPEDQLVELRPTCEVPEMAIDSARRIAPDAMADATFSTRHRIILRCRSGLRAWRAGRQLQQRGFTDIALMADGDVV